MKKITDPNFAYVPSYETDIKKRFAKIRKQLAQEAPKPAPETPPNVSVLKRTRSA